MRLTTKGSYGLRAIVDIAMNSNGKHVTLNSVAQRQNLSAQYLEQLFSTLKKAGYIKSIKGSGGGYSLAIAADKITVAMILIALEGDVSIVANVKNRVEDNNIENSIFSKVWSKIDESMYEVINQVTIKDLVDESQRLEGNNPLMFYI